MYEIFINIDHQRSLFYITIHLLSIYSYIIYLFNCTWSLCPFPYLRYIDGRFGKYMVSICPFFYAYPSTYNDLQLELESVWTCDRPAITFKTYIGRIMRFCNWMIKEQVSNIGIFAQKTKVFKRPPHGTHRETVTVSIIFRYDFFFTDLYTTRHER